jgi:hypothetical protein
MQTETKRGGAREGSGRKAHPAGTKPLSAKLWPKHQLTLERICKARKLDQSEALRWLLDCEQKRITESNAARNQKRKPRNPSNLQRLATSEARKLRAESAATTQPKKTTR